MSRNIPVDSEHLGIRIIMPLLIVGGLLGGYMLGSTLLKQVDASLSGVCGGVPMALLLTFGLVQFGERILKPLWSSGRSLTLYDNELVVHDKRHGKSGDLTFTPNTDLNAYFWYFEVATRKSRVPKGWYCASIALEEAKHQVVLYSFISPEQAATIPDFAEHFTRLISNKTRPTLDTREAAQQKRLRHFEEQRWRDGGELAAPDFIDIVQRFLP